MPVTVLIPPMRPRWIGQEDHIGRHHRLRGAVVPGLQAFEEVPRGAPRALRMGRHRRRPGRAPAGRGDPAGRTVDPDHRLPGRGRAHRAFGRGPGPKAGPADRGCPEVLRPRDRRRRSGWSLGRDLRGARGHRNRRHRAQRPRRTGWCHRADRQLPGLPGRHQGQPTWRTASKPRRGAMASSCCPRSA